MESLPTPDRARSKEQAEALAAAYRRIIEHARRRREAQETSEDIGG